MFAPPLFIYERRIDTQAMSERSPLNTRHTAKPHKKRYSYTCIQFDKLTIRGRHMPKQNPLMQGLEQQAPASVATVASPSVKTARTAAPSRSGHVLVGGHFAPEVQTALKIVTAQERTTVQALLAEGINSVFAKRGKPEIAEFTAGN
jgi:hypothetical protein